MALLYCDSFDHYSSNAEFVRKRWTPSNADAGTSTTGRHSTRAMTHGAWNRHVDRQLGVNAATLIAGAAFYYSAAWPAATHRMFCFMDGSTLQTELRVNSSGFLNISRADTGLVTAVTNQLVINTWYYVEFKATCNNSTGAWEARVNGVPVLTATGQDTQNTANAYYNQIRIGSYTTTGAGTWYVDDFYVCDTTGGAANDFLGDSRVECLWPTGDGNSSQFVGSDGNSVSNYLLVDDPVTTDDDTTYVQGTVLNDKDTYAYGNLATVSGDVVGVQASPVMRKTTAGTRHAVSVARLSATEEDSDVSSLSDSYLNYPEIFATKPGSGAWTIADVNSAEFGVKVAN